MSEPTGTFRLMYRSRDLISPEEREVALGELFSLARSRNKARGICGALLIDGDRFVQTLEGDEESVRDLFGRIEQDDRHDRVELLSTATVAGPVFARWSMARVGHDGEPDIPLIAHLDGIAPAAGRRTTPEQDAVLEVMRAAARVGTEVV
jgi:hypothetical protein